MGEELTSKKYGANDSKVDIMVDMSLTSST